MPTEQQMLRDIDRIGSPRARRVVRQIAEGLFAGRLSVEDVELLCALSERLALPQESSLSADELLLVQRYRALDARQREGAQMMLSLFGPNPG